jgi:hypothetical protein
LRARRKTTLLAGRALKAYPNNKYFMLEELNDVPERRPGQRGVGQIDRAIAADPTN